jgi:hypothetical protein
VALAAGVTDSAGPDDTRPLDRTQPLRLPPPPDVEPPDPEPRWSDEPAPADDLATSTPSEPSTGETAEAGETVESAAEPAPPIDLAGTVQLQRIASSQRSTEELMTTPMDEWQSTIARGPVDRWLDEEDELAAAAGSDGIDPITSPIAITAPVPITQAEAGPARQAKATVGRRFWAVLMAITVLGFGVRMTYIQTTKQDKESCNQFAWVPENICGDAYVYHAGANLLADGKGFISPPNYAFGGELRPSADHPPTYIVYLAAWSAVGLDTVWWHQFATALFGVLGVFLAGILGRAIAEWVTDHARGTPPPPTFADWSGWLAALLIAIAPSMFMNDANVMSETSAYTLTIAMVWVALRWWNHPTWQRAAVFGVVAGICAQTRAELVIYAPIFAFIALVTARHRWKQIFGTAVVAGLTLLAVLAPWTVRNLTTFRYPVTMSTGLGITLTYTNCDQTYSGDLLGYWYLPCIQAVDLTGSADQSEDERRLREHGLDYVRANTDRLPAVVSARLGRQWGLYRVDQMTAFDTFDARERPLSRLTWGFYYPSMILSVVALVVLRRHRLPISAFLIVPAIITLIAAITYGSTRFRTPSDALALVLAAFTIAWLNTTRRPVPTS